MSSSGRTRLRHKPASARQGGDAGLARVLGGGEARIRVQRINFDSYLSECIPSAKASPRAS